MKYALPLLLFLGGCILDLLPHADEMKGTEKINKDEGPTNIGLHAAILRDVRRDRVLAGRLEEGTPTCAAVSLSGPGATCAIDGEDMVVLKLRQDPLDQQNRVEETAFYCSREGLYYYRYEGGPRKLNVWLGPFKIDR